MKLFLLLPEKQDVKNQLLLIILAHCTIASAIAFPADPCEQATATSNQVFFLDHDGAKTQTSSLGSPHFTHVSFEQEVKLACQRVRQQLQSIGWGNTAACKGLLDPRSADELQRSYFEGPNDPRRCITSIRLSDFKQRMFDFLQAKGFGNDLNGHIYTSSDAGKLLKTLDTANQCSKKSTLAEKFSCYSQNFESLAKRLEHAEKLLADRKQNLVEACGALNAASLDSDAIALIAQVSQNRHRPDNLSAKDYPAFQECRPFDFPRLLSSCKGTPTATPLSDDAWACLKKGINTIWRSSSFLPPSGTTNIFRDRLAELRSKAIELSVLERLCILDSDATGLFDENKKPNSSPNKPGESNLRCGVAAFEELRKIHDWDSWVQKKSPSSNPVNVASAPPNVNCAPEKSTAPVSNTVAQGVKAIGRIASKANADEAPLENPPRKTRSTANADDSSLLEADQKDAKTDDATLSEAAILTFSEEEKKKTLDDLRKKFIQVVPPPVSPPMPGVSKQDEAIAIQAKYRTEEELIKAARFELKAWKEKTLTDFQFAQFFLETEFSDHKANQSQLYFQRILGRYFSKKREYEDFAKQTQGSNDDRIDALMQKLNGDFLKDYTADNALLTNFLEGDGGNCEAESKFTVNLLRDLKLNPDDGKVVGIQVFDDHVQPVIFDKKKRIVWDLHTGGQTHGLIAPIYQPEILLKGYLDAKSTRSPVSAEELLIEPFNEEEKRLAKARGGLGKGALTNTNLKLPKTGTVFSDGPIPKKSVISIQSRHQRVAEAKDFKPGKSAVTGGPSNSENTDPFRQNWTWSTCLAEAKAGKYTIPEDEKQKGIDHVIEGLRHLDEHPNTLRYSVNGRFWFYQYIFRYCSDRDKYVKTYDPNAKEATSLDPPRQELIKIIRKEFRETLHSESFSTFRALLSDPTMLTSEDEPVLEKFKKAESEMDYFGGKLSKGQRIPYAKEILTEDVLDAEFLRTNGILEKTATDAGNFYDSVVNNPENFFTLISQANARQWELFKELVRQSCKFSRHFKEGAKAARECKEPALFGSWMKFLADADKIGIKQNYRMNMSERAPKASVPRRDLVKDSHLEEKKALERANEELNEAGQPVPALPPASAPSRLATVHLDASEGSGDAKEEKKAVSPLSPKKPVAGLASLSDGSDLKSQSGAGNRKSGSSQKPEAEPKIQLAPAIFANLLFENAIRWSGPIPTANLPIVLRWTPGLSEALLNDPKHEINSSDYTVLRTWFLIEGYLHLSHASRKQSQMTYPSPTGSQDMSKDAALLYLKWLDLPIESKEIVTFGPGANTYDFKKTIERIEAAHGSIEKYKQKLRQSLGLE